MVHPTAEQCEYLVTNLREILDGYDAISPGATVRPVDEFFLYRLLLGRHPHPELELPRLLAGNLTHREFVTLLVNSPEFATGGSFMPGNRLLMAELPDFRFWFNTSDHEMGVRMALGSYEASSVALVRELVKPGMHTLDVGAQTGFFTCLMARLVGGKGRVHAFEPMPPSFEVLEKNVRENRFARIVELHPMAASSAPATIEGTMVSNMYVVGQVVGGEPVRIEAVRIDDLVTDRIDFVKIDIEGHEPSAIEGMRRLIERHRPTIVTEVNEYWLRCGSKSSGREYLELLSSLGYELFDVEKRDAQLSPESLCLDLVDVINVVAFPSK